MNPFAAQQRAFEWAQSGNLEAASAQFGKALSGFDRLLSEERHRALIAGRAALIPGHEERAGEVATQFLRLLPEWLRDLHFESFYEALTRYEIKSARMHWRLVKTAALLPALSTAINLDILHEIVCKRLEVTRDAIAESASGRAGVLSRTERILATDGENKPARRLAVYGYTSEILAAVDRLAPARKHKEPANTLDSLTTGQRQRLRVRLRRIARRLRQHLRQSRTKVEADIDEMVSGYKQLCHYYIGIGELETAIRLSRRARRLRPGDGEVRRWARRIRRLRRQR